MKVVLVVKSLLGVWQVRGRVQVQEGAHPRQARDEEQNQSAETDLPGSSGRGTSALRSAFALLLRLGRLLILLFHVNQTMR